MKPANQKPRPRVLATGGPGKLGNVCVADLQAHGYGVFVVDTVAADKSAGQGPKNLG